jgi:hypothetical protein
MQLAKVLVLAGAVASLVAGAVASSEGADSSLRTSVNGALQGDHLHPTDKDWMATWFKKLEARMIELQNKCS